MAHGISRDGRGLVVLADGVQAAFAAGAIGELARQGAHWQCAVTAGLGAQLGVLALLGDAIEGEHRWVRQGENHCPLFVTQIAAIRQRLGETMGVIAVPDGFAMAGWLDDAALVEHLAPEMAAVPQRLVLAGASCYVAVEDLNEGLRNWIALESAPPQQAAAAIEAAARFPAGWGALNAMMDGRERRLWGGVGALPENFPAIPEGAMDWDVVCGFPLPCVPRPALGGSIWELMQRRAEIASARMVETLLSSLAVRHYRVFAPNAIGYSAFCERAREAELGIEYPLPWERNGELVSVLVAFGAFIARQSLD